MHMAPEQEAAFERLQLVQHSPIDIGIALLAAAVFFGLILLVVAYSTFFTVYQTKQALVVRLGQPVRVVTEPGLNAKIPFIDSVTCTRFLIRSVGHITRAYALARREGRRFVVVSSITRTGIW